MCYYEGRVVSGESRPWAMVRSCDARKYYGVGSQSTRWRSTVNVVWWICYAGIYETETKW